MKNFILSLVLALFCVGASAADVKTEAQVQQQLIQQLNKDGYLSDKVVPEVTAKYVNTTKQEETWTRYLSWVSFAKVAGIAFLLFALWGTIVNIMKGVWFIIIKVPAINYQLGFLFVSILSLTDPQIISVSQTPWVIIFSSFSTLMILAWIALVYEEQIMPVVKFFFRLNIPVHTLISFYLTVYFGAIALYYQSSVLGFFAVVALSALTSFTMEYRPGVLYLKFNEKKLSLVVFGHLIVVGAYIAAATTGHYPPGGLVFKAGFEYYCSIALGVGLICGSSPWWEMNKREITLGYAALFTVTTVVLMYIHFMTNVQVPGSVLCVFFILFLIEWLGYIGFKGGAIIGCLIIGATLYGLSLFLEHHSQYFIFALQ